MSERPGRAIGAIARGMLAAAFLAAATLILPVIRAEHQSEVREAAAEVAMGGAAPLPWQSPGQDGACGAGCPARARAAIGVSDAFAAAQTTDAAERVRASGEAEVWLRTAIAARPSAGEWWAWLAYAQLAHDDGFDAVEDDIAKSYDRSPFLAHLAAWRIRVCAYYWPRLNQGLRASAENEIVWLRDIDPEAEEMTLQFASDPAARDALRSALGRPPAPSVPHRRSRSPGGVGLLGRQRL